jgi:ELWxxDGT repeat protein
MSIVSLQQYSSLNQYATTFVSPISKCNYMIKNVLLFSGNRIDQLRKVYIHVFVGIVFMLAGIIVAHAQPVLLKPLSNLSKNFTTANGRLFYTSADSLFTSNGTTAGTVLVKKLGEPVNLISKIFIGNEIFIITQSSSSLQSLWVSDGTLPNTTKIATYPTILPAIAYQSELYLKINDGVHGEELWKLSASHTLSMLKDINPGIANGFKSEIVISNNTLFFKANAGISGTDLWKSDGTSSGTELAVDVEHDDYYGIIDVNGTIFYTRRYEDPSEWVYITELWKTQGTAASTVLVKTFEGDYFYNDLSHFTVMNGKLYFIHNHGIPVHDLWVSDGTEANTQFLEQVTIDGSVIEMFTMKNHLIYNSQSQSFPGPIEKSDGTVGGAQSIHELSWYYSLGGSNDWVNLTPTDSLLFFVDDIQGGIGTPDNELQLWQSDLTSQNTKPVIELFNISLRGSDNVVAAGNAIFFTTTAPGQAFTLWYYDPMAPTLCAGTGGVLHELWTNVQGNQVSAIPVDTPPAAKDTLNIFEGTINAGNHYGSRYRGYLCVPQTGNYQFWIASNDHSELWLSSSTNPEDKVKIAYVEGYTAERQYTKYPSQQSSLIYLTAGHQYYIEALHKEGVGTDHISVGMKLPDGTLERPIPGTRLIPFNDNKLPTVSITSPPHLQTFHAPATVEIRADATDEDGMIVKVEFYNNNIKLGEDLFAPYSFTWNNVPEGFHLVVVKATDNHGEFSTASRYVIVKGCAFGKITQEVWHGVYGASVADIPLNSPPNTTNDLTLFEGPSNVGVHYASRIRGYVCAPLSGNYTFYIASNDHSELWLSTDDNAANKIKVAHVTGATGIRQWNKYSSQRSVPLWLDKDKRYYIEALHKQGVGTDNIAVGWTLPDGRDERPIPGTRLSPFVSGTAIAQKTDLEESTFVHHNEIEEKISLSPNPAGQGTITLTLSGYANENVEQITIEIVSMMNEVLFSASIPCRENCNIIELPLKEKINTGVYMVNGVINGKRFSKRLVIH